MLPKNKREIERERNAEEPVFFLPVLLVSFPFNQYFIGIVFDFSSIAIRKIILFKGEKVSKIFCRVPIILHSTVHRDIFTRHDGTKYINDCCGL